MREAHRSRVARRVIASLIVGTALTVGAAWGLALWSPAGVAARAQEDSSEEEWPAPVPPEWPRCANGGSTFRGPGVKEYYRVNAAPTTGATTTRELAAEDPEQAELFEQWVLASGWPWAALRCESNLRCTMQTERIAPFLAPPRNWREGLAAPGGIGVPETVSGRHLPLVPVLPGFVADTLLFAIVCFAGLALGRRMVIAGRRRRGACGECGHRLVGDGATCPECGAAVPQ